MQPRKKHFACANGRLLLAAGLVTLAALFGAASGSAAAFPGTLSAPVGPVGPAGLRTATLGDATATAARLQTGKTYGGRTSQVDPIVLGLSSKRTRVVRLAIDIDANCTSGMSLGTGGVLTPNLPVSKAGRVKGTILSSIDGATETGTGVITLKGKLGSSRGSGTVAVHFDFVDKQSGAKTDSCDTGTLRWGATTAKGRVFGGSTSQRSAVVLELSRDLRRVSTVRIGWLAPCSPDGAFHVGDVLRRFPLSASRAFGDTFSQTVPAEGGGQNKLDYQVHGKAGKTKASGRLQVHVTATDATGATVATCDTGVVTWHASSG